MERCYQEPRDWKQYQWAHMECVTITHPMDGAPRFLPKNARFRGIRFHWTLWRLWDTINKVWQGTGFLQVLQASMLLNRCQQWIFRPFGMTLSSHFRTVRRYKHITIIKKGIFLSLMASFDFFAVSVRLKRLIFLFHLKFFCPWDKRE